jgi:hypothetical protein
MLIMGPAMSSLIGAGGALVSAPPKPLDIIDSTLEGL